MKILVVDDEATVLLLLEKGLTEMGYEVRSSDNIFDAVLCYNIFQPDLVMMDINMPTPEDDIQSVEANIEDKKSGLEILKYIRYVKKDNVPVAILSGNNKEEIIERSFELGANTYIKKPLNLGKIATRLKNIIGGNTDRYMLAV